MSILLTICLTAGLLCLSAPALALTREEQTAEVTGNSRLTRYAQPCRTTMKQYSKICLNTSKGAQLTEINKDAVCYVIGETDTDYYIATVKGSAGYVPKNKVDSFSPVTENAPETKSWQVSITDPDIPFLQLFGETSPLSGMIESDLPLTEIRVELFNFRNITEECGVYRFFDASEDIRSFDLSTVRRQLPFASMRPGDRYLTITVRAGGAERVLYNSVFCIGGNFSRQYSATADCAYNVNDSNLKKLTDGSCLTGWKMGKGKTLKITFPEGRKMHSLQLEFIEIRHDIHITVYGKDGVLEDYINENIGSFYITDYSLPEGAVGAEIALEDGSDTLAELYVYEEGRVPNVAQHWEQVPEKVDVMLIIAHRNDECLFFGGIIPWCVSQGKRVAVVYMTDPSLGRPSYTETLNALWVMGLRYYPLYLGMVDERNTWEQTILDWGGYENMYEKTVGVIRKYKPDVVIGHDLNGEFGHFNHILTADATLNGVLLAGDETACPESAAEWGVWEVPKYYIHLWKPENRINVDFKTPLESLMNLSPLQTAYVAFEKHTTEAHHSEVYSLDSFGKDYDNTCFSLYRSLVGDDVKNDSFFENLE